MDVGTHSPEAEPPKRHGSPDRGQKGQNTMKTNKTFEIEISRSNVTPAQFLSYVRRNVDRKGGEMLRGDLGLAYFAAGNDLNFDIHHEEPEFDGLHEKSVSKPYEMQTYLRYSNGAVYNEICEFTFDDEKTGHGYYYLVNVEAVEEEEQTAERLCAPWELRKTENGRRDPNPRETWIDVQSRALFQAAQLVLRVAF